MKYSNEEGIKIVLNMINIVQKNRDLLSEIDGETGDGDHGINLNKGFTFVSDQLAGKKVDMSDALELTGRTLMTRIGGSIGPLFGTIFNEMGKASKGIPEIDEHVVGKMIRWAVDGVSKISTAREGDKTLMDVLLPAAKSFKEAEDQGEDLIGALIAMKKSADDGKEATRDMVAKIGRSSRLGERSRGHLDAGAVSMNLIIQTFADTVISLVKEYE